MTKTNLQSLTKVIIKRTHKVPVTVNSPNGEYPTSQAVSRQLDVALMSEGFKASPEVLNYVSGLSLVGSTEVAREITEAVKEIKGSHVNHNVYFKDFPNNVPDTIEFWSSLIQKTYGDNITPFFVNLLALDGYGAYQHTYEEMVKAHEAFNPKPKDFTLLNLGKSVEDEVYALYLSLAESKVPANEDDLKLLKRLAELCLDYKQPEKIPVRENKAIINAVRVQFGVPVLADTITDVIRLAAQLSDSDPTLQTKPKFKAFPNKTRSLLLEALDRIVTENEAKLGDVYKNRETIKRLFYRLNNNGVGYANAYKVLEYAVNGYNTSFESKLEKAFKGGDISEVVAVLENNPGLFVRSLNRLLLQSKIKDIPTVTSALAKVAGKVSTPVLVGLRQYLGNRKTQKTYRVFINRKGTGKVVEDTQPILGAELLNPIVELIDKEVASRLPEATYVISRNMLNVALPLSNKQTNDGFGVMPRGSVDSLNTEVLRFFTYWKQDKHTTDFDLSAILLDENFKQVSQLSYTQLSAVGGVHSGDITNAPDGASEFIDIETAKVTAKYVVPQVNVYSGEGFNEVEESFFGYMERTLAEKGLPFEAQTVKSKAEMRGEKKVALPLIFINDGGAWTVKWLNAFLNGYECGNRTENNALSTATMVQSVVENNYLTISYVVDLLFKRNMDGNFRVYFEDELAGQEDFEKLVESKSNTYYIARDIPPFVNDTDVKTITLKNLHELLF